jgi:hypothetical protein
VIGMNLVPCFVTLPGRMIRPDEFTLSYRYATVYIYTVLASLRSKSGVLSTNEINEKGREKQL